MTRSRLVAAIGAAFLAGVSATVTGQQVPGDPWAIGYAAQVAQNCPSWQMERQQVLAERGVLPPVNAGSQSLAMNGPFQRLYYEGQQSAEADRRRTKDFCRRLPSVVARNWSRLARVLRTSR